MGQNYSSRILSLHLDPCVTNCSHRKICYHRNKNIIQENNICNKYDEFLSLGYKTYEFICGDLTKGNLYILKKYKHYHLTVSSRNVLVETLDKKLSDKQRKRINISIYNLKEAIEFKDYNKLFLIKDLRTLMFFYILGNNADIGRIHYLVEQNYILNEPNILRDIIKFFNTYGKINSKATMDSCLTSILFNNKCPYTVENCIDITYDGTIRRCPFSRDGIKIPDNIELNQLWELDLPECNCVFKKLLGDK